MSETILRPKRALVAGIKGILDESLGAKPSQTKESKEEPNIVRPDGSLSITVPAKEVSWYDFLANSRIHNSKQGGWNDQSHWYKRALQRLLANLDVIPKLWTENSLTGKTDPAIRSGKFMFDRKFSAERAALALREDDKSENGLNARLFQEHSTVDGKLFLGNIRFKGYEIPLCQTRAGMLRIDLIGEICAAGAGIGELAIVELKKEDGNDSPLMAFTEAVCYALQLIRGKVEVIAALKSIGVFWDGQRRIDLCLAAPKAYWHKWLTREHLKDTRKLLPLLSQIVDRVNDVLIAHGEATLTLRVEPL